MHLQFCADSADITSSPYAARDATEVRAWEEDATLIGACEKNSRGFWHVSGSFVRDWVPLSRQAHRSWEDALKTLGVHADADGSARAVPVPARRPAAAPAAAPRPGRRA